MDNLIIDLKRTDERVHFECVSSLHPEQSVPFDYVPPLGTGVGFSGLEMLLTSFCGCVSTAVIGLLLRAGKHVTSYSVHAEGVRSEQPLSLSKILFQINISSLDVSGDDMSLILRQAEQISPVWIAVRNNIEIDVSCDIQSPQ